MRKTVISKSTNSRLEKIGLNDFDEILVKCRFKDPQKHISYHLYTNTGTLSIGKKNLKCRLVGCYEKLEMCRLMTQTRVLNGK